MLKKMVLMALLSMSALAQAADLAQIYQQAQQQDPVFAAAKAARAVGQEKPVQGRALLLPTVGLSGQTQRATTETDVAGSNSDRTIRSNAWSVSVSQPLFRLQNLAQARQGEQQGQLSEAQFNSAQQDLILRVAQAYFDVLLAQDKLAYINAQRTAITEQLAQAKRNFEVGNATITDTHEAQARFDLNTAQQSAAESDLEVKKRALEQIIGSPVSHLSAVHQQRLALQAPVPASVEAWLALAETHNPQFQAQQAAVKIAELALDQARAAHWPTVDAVASVGRNHQNAYWSNNVNLGALSADSKTIGLQLNIPLYQGGALNSKVREALASQEKARQELEDTRRKITLQVRQAYLGVTTGVAQVKALSQALVSSQSSLDSTKLGQEVGVRTNVDVLNAQQQYFSAKRDLAEARYNYILSQLRLAAAVGKLDESDVVRVNQWLDK